MRTNDKQQTDLHGITTPVAVWTRCDRGETCDRKRYDARAAPKCHCRHWHAWRQAIQYRSNISGAGIHWPSLDRLTTCDNGSKISEHRRTIWPPTRTGGRLHQLHTRRQNAVENGTFERPWTLLQSCRNMADAGELPDADKLAELRRWRAEFPPHTINGPI